MPLDFQTFRISGEMANWMKAAALVLSGLRVETPVAMSMCMAVAVVMPVFVGMAADFHIAAAETASAFFAHKILACSGGL